jgi:hypothetical protein
VSLKYLTKKKLRKQLLFEIRFALSFRQPLEINFILPENNEAAPWVSIDLPGTTGVRLNLMFTPFKMADKIKL